MFLNVTSDTILNMKFTNKQPKKLVCVIACRNDGTRLYAKPLQILDPSNNITVLDNLINTIRLVSSVDEIVLAIANKKSNQKYEDIAKNHKIKFYYGSEKNVLGRLIIAAKSSQATDILRVTSESPFPIYHSINKSWLRHKDMNYDATFMDNVIDGCGYEIINLKALYKSNRLGSAKHRSEFCTLYLRENKKYFNLFIETINNNFQRKDLRLTVDNPEDLIVCREVYKRFKTTMPRFDMQKIINFLDSRKDLKIMMAPFLEKGYRTMYL